jgi:dipeptidyl aminopeptidase/acylaminoacyl peptidase
VLRDSTTEYYVIDIASGGMRQIGHPSDSLKLMAYDSANDLALFLAAGPTGTYLTRVRADQQQAIASLNTFMRNINECQWRTFEYTSFEGQDLKAGLILPANFKVGQRYPLVTLVYGGAIVDERSRIALGGTINNSYSGADNAQLLAARGYLVLWPSIPLKPFPNGKNYKGSDPYLELTNGVLPAVEKVIEMGIADPQRLAVMGHSYGGYSVYGLVTQTNRFKAAISAAGFADLLSYFGTLSMASRYENFAHERNFSAMWAETGQGRMGNPPWKDLGRYLRNSPIIYVDRVQTPLLIIQGDLDSVAMQQGDEFFMALYRQGKRARFIRYWGEGHDISSPANIRDLWNQTYVWIDEFCDISRDEKGNLIFDGDHVKSRNGALPLKPEDFNRFNEIELRNHQWVNKRIEN